MRAIGRRPSYKMTNLFIPTVLLLIVNVNCCYWNSECSYQLYGSATPYDAIRGDIRDHAIPSNCQAVSMWTIIRHGNRNPSDVITDRMKKVSVLKDEIIASYAAGNSQLCAQDIQNLKKWTWNSTLEVTPSELTGTGYEELYGIGERIREKYRHLLVGTPEQFYFRPSHQQRTITSCAAFIHGITDGINLNVTVEDPWPTDDVLRAYPHCDRYQKEVKGGKILKLQKASYYKTPVYISIQNAVQKRLGIDTSLTAKNVFAFYEMCRFYRTWSPNLKSPWCSFFTDEDLVELEYYDDVKHYYRNGYGSWINQQLGHMPLKDLYENFNAFIQGGDRKLVSYFTHDTMMEMVICALGLYKDDAPLQSVVRDPTRKWRTSFFGGFSVNVIAVLNSCNDSADQSYRVQIFVNEKETPLCPLEGCTWQEFKDMFEPFTGTNLDFCNMTKLPNAADPSTNRSGFRKW